MKIYAPLYYKKFKCIADKCKHNCCIGWEIDIDCDTLQYYLNPKTAFGNKIISNICFDETPHFRLNSEDRCPFLNNSGLCDIINELGEGALCQICSDHPRFKNFYNLRTEFGLGLCCEAAVELIIKDTDTFSLILIDEDDTVEENSEQESELFEVRKSVMDILDMELDFADKSQSIIDKYELSFGNLKSQYWFEIFKSLERLDAAWDNILLNLKKRKFISISCCDEMNNYLTNVLKYLIYRHFINLSLEFGVSDSLKFCLLSCFIISSLAKDVFDFPEIARMYSSEIEYSDENIYKIIESI